MGSVKDYFSSLGAGIASLVKGMTVTGKEFVTPKLTENILKTATPSTFPIASARFWSLSTMPRDATSA